MASSEQRFARFLARHALSEVLLKRPCPRPDEKPLDRDVLRAALGLGKRGRGILEEQHRAAFESTDGRDRPELVSMEASVALDLTRRDAARETDAAALADEPPTIFSAKEEAEVIPWSGWDIARVSSYIGGALVLAFSGVRSMAMLLEGSDIPAFAEGETANQYLFSFVTLIALAQGLKGARDHLFETNAARINFTRVITLITVAAALIWALQFSVHYGAGFSAELPTISLSMDEAVEETGGHGGAVLTFCALISEAFGSGLLLIFAAMLFEKYRRPPRIPNPTFVELEELMDYRDREIAYLIALGSRLRGRIEATRRSADVYVGRAAARFEVAIQAAIRAEMAAKYLEEEPVVTAQSAPPAEEPTPPGLSEPLVKPIRGTVLTDEDGSAPHGLNGTPQPIIRNNGATQ